MTFDITFIIEQEYLYYIASTESKVRKAAMPPMPQSTRKENRAIKQLAKDIMHFLHPQSPLRRLKKLRAKILIEMGTDEASKRRIENFFHQMGIFRELHLYDREHKHIGDISREIYLYC